MVEAAVTVAGGYLHGKAVGYNERAQEAAAAEMEQRRLDRDARETRGQATG